MNSISNNPTRGNIRLPIAKDDYDNFVNHIEIARKDIDILHTVTIRTFFTSLKD